LGLIAVLCLCGLVVVGCRRTSLGGSPVPPSPTVRVTPSAAVIKSVAQTAPNPEEQFQRQYEVVVVVNGFLQAVQKEDWAKAANFFSAEFRKTHEKDLLDGSLLSYDPHAGKSTEAMLHSPGAFVERVTIRGDRAWAEVRTGGSPWSQAGIMALELMREEGEWKLLRFPSPSGTLDVLRAGYDGEAAGRWFKGMLSDGEFTEEEQAKIAEVLDRYYAVVVQMESQVEGRHLHSPDYRSATTEELRRIAERLKDRPDLKPHSIIFWPKPSEDVLCVREALAEQAVRQVYEDLAVAKDKYPELAKFDEENVRLSENKLSYHPSPPQGTQKITKPYIWVSIRISVPNASESQVSFNNQILLPRQKLGATRYLSVDDKQLAEFVKETIEKNIEPLIRFEKLLGGEPVYDNW